MRRLSFSITLSTLLLVNMALAQQAPTTSVPNLIRYSGTLKDAQGAALVSTAPVGVTFAVYKQQDGGAPVWQETQNVTPDANGQYSVLLGNATATGLPDDLFSQQEQRWLGVQVQGQAEQPRVLMVSVPYAFKAHEAETLGGKSISDFVLAKGANSAANGGVAAPAGPSTSNAVPASSGTRKGAASAGPTNFSGSTTDQIVSVTQSGTGAGVKASAPTLGISGTATAPSGTAYGVQGVASGTAGVGLIGTATSTTGSTYGLRGTSSSTSGTGVRGIATATSGSTTGISGYVNSTSGTAAAFNNAAGGKIISGQNNGVEKLSVDGGGNVTTSGTISTTGLSGTTSAPTGVGLTGNATDLTGQNTGVMGKTASSNGTGVNGLASATTGQNVGVYGESDSSAGWGVYGYAAGTTTQVIGVEGLTSSTGQGAAGILGYEGATTGHVFGVHGITTSTTDFSAGVAGNANGTSGLTWGVNGQTASTTSNVAGVHGAATATTGQVYGVSGDISSTTDSAAGVRGVANGTAGATAGVFGSSASASGAGGVFQNSSTATGAKILIAQDSAGTSRFAVDTSGNISVTTGTTSPVTVSLPVNHARTTFESSADGGYAFVTLTWAFPFQDTNYTATCTPQASDTQLWFFQTSSISMTSVVVEIATYAVQEEITIHCIGIHD